MMLSHWCWHDAVSAITITAMAPPLILARWRLRFRTDAGMMAPQLSISLLWCRHWLWHDNASAVTPMLVWCRLCYRYDAAGDMIPPPPPPLPPPLLIRWCCYNEVTAAAAAMMPPPPIASLWWCGWFHCSAHKKCELWNMCCVKWCFVDCLALHWLECYVKLVFFIACVVLHLHFQGFLGGEKSRRFPVRAELEKDSWKNGKRQQFHCLAKDITFSWFLLHLCGRAQYCRFTFTFSPLPCRSA